MRGKPVIYAVAQAPPRITPAYAGKTTVTRVTACHKRDHPRVCGENLLTYGYNSSNMGSPPRMRGKHRTIQLPIVKIRITPAYAGKTSPFSVGFCIVKDHPRVCGENRQIEGEYLVRLGSPPRMRGKLPANHSKGFEAGITPAYAGKTAPGRAVASLRQDHPRVCGENISAARRIANLQGSPPRMRGKPGIRCLCLLEGRITPAYAGKTESQNPITPAQKDHPRVCGENVLLNTLLLKRLGSPPRMRGKLLISAGTTGAGGITPAYAGKT